MGTLIRGPMDPRKGTVPSFPELKLHAAQGTFGVGSGNGNKELQR